jgi:hypothetical protein
VKLIAFVALALLLAACTSGAPETRSSAPAEQEKPSPTAELDRAWAIEQLHPSTKAWLEALRDERWSDAYDDFTNPNCPRSEFVFQITSTRGLGDWEAVMEAALQELEDGSRYDTYEFLEISAERITHRAAPDAPLRSEVLTEDGWRGDGTFGVPCMENLP